MKKVLIIFVLLALGGIGFRQKIDNTFYGWWATTEWTFIFKADNSYERISEGHYGNTVVKGTYRLENDTIEILSGHQNTHGTINQYYLYTKDCIVDIKDKHTYCLKMTGIEYDPKEKNPK